MTNTNTPQPPPKRSKRWARGLASLALLAATPKCGLCVAGYLGIGAALGLRTREICGETPSSPLLPWASVALVVVSVFTLWLSTRSRRQT